jgi:hypothetical protein
MRLSKILLFVAYGRHAYHYSYGMVFPTPHYYSVRGRATEIARSLGSPFTGAEHLFLGMLHDGGWPVSVISSMVGLASAEAAVHAIWAVPVTRLRLARLSVPSCRAGMRSLCAAIGYLPKWWLPVFSITRKG